jgi:hypothetical protein
MEVVGTVMVPGDGSEAVTLATQEAEIRKIIAESQPRQIVREILSRKGDPSQRAGGVALAQGVIPEIKPQYWKKKKKALEQLPAVKTESHWTWALKAGIQCDTGDLTVLCLVDSKHDENRVRET